MDIETSGTDFLKCGVWQIGAIDLATGEEFLEESRIDDGDRIVNMPGDSKTCLEVIGKTEEELRDKNKQSQKQLIENFFKWIENKFWKNFLCQNPVFDVGFLNNKSSKYGLIKPFYHRSFDLHNIAQIKYFELNGKFLIKKNHRDMGLKNILEFCGMKDERKAHNALEDCKLTAECFYRLVYGRNFFSEYSKFEIPKYLK